MPNHAHRLPISTRYAFLQAFDLAVRRDPLHSLVVPILLRAPWVLALALLPPVETLEDSSATLVLASFALIGDFITLLVIGAMLRVRARSVFNTPPGVRPISAAECYARGFRRIPWLLSTEVARNVLLGIAAYCTFLPTAFLRLSAANFFEDLSHNFLQIAVALSLLMPTLFLGFRLGVATESVVLDEHDMADAFQRSFRIMRGRFERWLELVTASGAIVLAVAMLVSLIVVMVPTLPDSARVAIFGLLVIAITPVIQYAWTFFYLRLVEIDEPILEVGPTYAQQAVPGHAPLAEPLEIVGRPGERGRNGGAA